LSLPGDPRLAEGIDWSKQNLADLTQEAHDLKIRFTNQGKQYPPAIGTLSKIRFLGAGFPDYPWLFATDREYTAFAAARCWCTQRAVGSRSWSSRRHSGT
jgi:hypothetical protein